MTHWDRGLLVCVLMVGVFLLGAGSLDAGEAADVGHARVIAPGGTELLDLSRDGRHVASGAMGEIEIEVRAGCARVVESPCPDQRCVHMGAVSGSSGGIVCVPGQVAVRPYERDQQEGLDCVVR